MSNFDFDKDTERALATKVSTVQPCAEVYDEKPNFDGFRARGGKFILFQGWADPVITPMMDVDFYNRIVARYGQAATDELFPLFSAARHGPLLAAGWAFPISAGPRARRSAMTPTTTWSRRWTDG